jgi:hypothetical protein
MSATIHTVPEPPGDASRQVSTAWAYLTDGVFLYRLVGPIAAVADELVEIEDCYSLDVVRVPLRDIHARKLRVVLPAYD